MATSKGKELDIFACPDCRGPLEEVRTKIGLEGLVCGRCSIVHPVREGIFILLPRHARSSRLERDLLVGLKKTFLGSPQEKKLSEAVDNTLALLDEASKKKAWEWEEEEFWAHEYSAEGRAVSEKNWNDRVWQREFLIDGLLKEADLKGKTILDCGSGEGQNFRHLMAKHCDGSTVYIAADISYDGLRLNRTRNPHSNSLYVLCSADWLPFRDGAIDVICYFGILHHTAGKLRNIQPHSKLLAERGHFLIHEPLDRPSPVPKSFSHGDPMAAHEDTLDKEQLLAEIRTVGDLTVVSKREFMTILYGGMMRFFRDRLMGNESLFRLLMRADMFLVGSLGAIVPYFRPREVMLLVRKGPRG